MAHQPTSIGVSEKTIHRRRHCDDIVEASYYTTRADFSKNPYAIIKGPDTGRIFQRPGVRISTIFRP